MSQENSFKEIINHIFESPQFRTELEIAVQHAVTSQQANNRTLPLSYTPISTTFTNSNSTNAGSTAPTSTPTPSTSRSSINTANSLEAEISRLFPSCRRTNFRSETSCDVYVPRKNKRSKSQRFTEFKRDIILLKSPQTSNVLKGSIRARAFNMGYAMNAVTFGKNWSSEKIIEHVKTLFSDKLRGIDFEILIGMSGHLVKINLSPGETLNGVNLCRLTNQKQIYIRPCQRLHGPISLDLCSNSIDISLSDSELEFDLEEHRTSERTSHDQTEINPKFYDSNDLQPAPATLDDTDDYNLAVENSLKSYFQETNDNAQSDLTTILTELSERINAENVTHVNIHRDSVLDCISRAINRKSFKPQNRFCILFTDADGNSEGAVDAGGPLREMFTLALRALNISNIFIGPETEKNINLDMNALIGAKYFEAGRIIALSIAHCGLGPNFFSKKLFDSLKYGLNMVKWSVNDIHDLEIKNQIETILNAESLETLQESLDCSAATTSGCPPFISDISKKSEIAQGIVEFYTVHRLRAPMESLIEGLRTLNVLDLIKKQQAMESLFCAVDKKLTAADLMDLFTVNYSENSSNRRTKENRLVGFLRDYLLDIEDGSSDTTLQDILMFFTGTDKIPALGFPFTPQLHFNYDDECPFPKGNTCGIQLLLPTVSENYNEFKCNMDYAFQNAKVFGFA